MIKPATSQVCNTQSCGEERYNVSWPFECSSTSGYYFWAYTRGIYRTRVSWNGSAHQACGYYYEDYYGESKYCPCNYVYAVAGSYVDGPVYSNGYQYSRGSYRQNQSGEDFYSVIRSVV